MVYRTLSNLKIYSDHQVESELFFSAFPFSRSLFQTFRLVVAATRREFRIAATAKERKSDKKCDFI